MKSRGLISIQKYIDDFVQHVRAVDNEQAKHEPEIIYSNQAIDNGKDKIINDNDRLKILSQTRETTKNLRCYLCT